MWLKFRTIQLCRWRRQLPNVSIDVSFLDAFVLGASILEPDLDLCICQAEWLRQFTAAWSRHVLDALVFHLELQSLLSTECCPLATSCWLMFLYSLLLLLLLLLLLMMTVLMVAFFFSHFKQVLNVNIMHAPIGDAYFCGKREKISNLIGAVSLHCDPLNHFCGEIATVPHSVIIVHYFSGTAATTWKKSTSAYFQSARS